MEGWGVIEVKLRTLTRRVWFGVVVFSVGVLYCTSLMFG